MTIQAPLHLGRVMGKPVRFFRSPGHPAPTLAWHVHDDLVSACGLNRELRRRFLKLAQETLGRTIATANGVVTIAPHIVAKSLLATKHPDGTLPFAQVDDEYCEAAVAALTVMAGDLHDEAMVAFSLEATKNALEGR